MSIEYDRDVRLATAALRDAGVGATRVDLAPLGDVLGRSTRFAFDGRLVEIIDAYPRCVPLWAAGDAPGPGRECVASTLYTLATAAACHLRAFLTNDGGGLGLAAHAAVCTRVLALREVDRQAFVVSDDFDLDHVLGETTSLMMEHMKVGGDGAWVRYNPARDRATRHRARERMLARSFASKMQCRDGAAAAT